ncbi:MAG TPA: SDR family oxidoreductase [Kiloniellales bacterium]|nr:SDR family oxidoreductase [Kiloniellales bacterium]
MASPLGADGPFDLSGKVAVVTGSSRGIGRAIVETFAAAGARVVVSSRTAADCEAVAHDLRTKGRQAIACAAHAGRADDIDALVTKTVAAWDGIDIVVCNAATNPVYGPLAELSEAAFDKVLATNLKGMHLLCQRALPLVAARGGGSAILVSSIAALRASKGLGAYGISKAAVAALARQLAAEWGPQGVRVNALAPGLIKTEFSRTLWEDPERLKRAEERTPLRRLGSPEDIAGVALFLAAPASAYVTGQVLVADGGETIV